MKKAELQLESPEDQALFRELCALKRTPSVHSNTGHSNNGSSTTEKRGSDSGVEKTSLRTKSDNEGLKRKLGNKTVASNAHVEVMESSSNNSEEGRLEWSLRRALTGATTLSEETNSLHQNQMSEDTREKGGVNQDTSGGNMDGYFNTGMYPVNMDPSTMGTYQRMYMQQCAQNDMNGYMMDPSQMVFAQQAAAATPSMTPVPPLHGASGTVNKNTGGGSSSDTTVEKGDISQMNKDNVSTHLSNTMSYQGMTYPPQQAFYYSYEQQQAYIQAMQNYQRSQGSGQESSDYKSSTNTVPYYPGMMMGGNGADYGSYPMGFHQMPGFDMYAYSDFYLMGGRTEMIDGVLVRFDKNGGRYVGAYAPEERKERIKKFREKRQRCLQAGRAADHAGQLLLDQTSGKNSTKKRKSLSDSKGGNGVGDKDNHQNSEQDSLETNGDAGGDGATTAAVRAERMIRYGVRKQFADSRMRVKGRFVKKEDENLLRELMSIS